MATPRLFQALFQCINSLLSALLLILFCSPKHILILLNYLVQIIRVLKIERVRHDCIEILPCRILPAFRVSLYGNLDPIKTTADHLILNFIIGVIVQIHTTRQGKELLLIRCFGFIFEHQEFVNFPS